MALNPNNWAHCITLIIDHEKIGSALSDFPLAIELSSSCGKSNADITAIFYEIGSSSKKIAITDSSYNQQYVEIQDWNAITKIAHLHTKVSSISSSADTILYLFYDSTQDDNTAYVGDTGDAVAQAVWDVDFAGVWHLVGNPSTASNIKDSTSNINHGTASNLEADDEIAGGLFGGELDFDNEWMLFGNDSSLQLISELTIEAVFKRDMIHGQSVGIVSKYLGIGNQRAYNLCMNTAEKLELILSRDGDTDPLTWLIGTTVMGDTEYYYGAGKYKSSDTTAELRLNNNQEDSTSSAISSVHNPAAHFSIGNQYGRDSQYSWGGRIAEVRLSKIKRGNDWCDATYYGLFDMLLTLSDEIPYTAKGSFFLLF